MGKEINIAEILKDKPQGTKLYSPMCGECHFYSITNSLIILEESGEETTNDGQLTFYYDGTYMRNGEVILFPSKEMRDWSKFAWKKGDVLVSNDGEKNIIFVEFINDTYTSFKGQYGYEEPTFNYDIEVKTTQNYRKATYSITAYISVLEKKLHGKLNLETLEIKPTKPKCELKPFDKVVVRDKDSRWSADFFSFKGSTFFVCIGGSWDFCLPYNEETAKLIGTINDYKED